MTVLTSSSQMILATLCAVLVGAIGYEANAPLPRVQLPAGAPESRLAAKLVLPSFRAAPSEAFNEISARPIFDRARAPVSSEALAGFVPPTGSGSSRPSVALLGTIIDGARRIAMIRAAASPRSANISVGDAVGGWTVTAIDADKIALRLGDERAEVRLGPSPSTAPRATEIGGTSTIATPGAVPDTNTQAQPPPDRTPH